MHTPFNKVPMNCIIIIAEIPKKLTQRHLLKLCKLRTFGERKKRFEAL